MDAFSEILSGFKLNRALFFSAELSAPWGVDSPPIRQLLIYHFVVEGKAVATLQDGQTIALEPGDIVIFPHGDPHRMSSVEGTASAWHESALLTKLKTRDLSPVRLGGGGAKTRFVCGFMSFDTHVSGHLLGGLPEVFKVNIHTDRSGHWLRNSILHLVDEAASGRAGSEAMLTKLSEVLFVDVVRRYVASMPEQQAGWLAGARDPIVGRSLSLLHSRVDHPWTIADLASEVGLSRSSLVERFTRYLAQPPMTYLTRWRLQLAARALQSTLRGVAEIAADVGYESEAAFNRAFKREYGLPPARYRRELRIAG